MSNQNRNRQQQNSGNPTNRQASSSQGSSGPGLTREQGIILVSLGIIATLIFVIVGLLFLMLNQNQPVQPVQVEATATDEVMVDSAVTATPSSQEATMTVVAATDAVLFATGQAVYDDFVTVQATLTPLWDAEAIGEDGRIDPTEEAVMIDALETRFYTDNPQTVEARKATLEALQRFHDE